MIMMLWDFAMYLYYVVLYLSLFFSHASVVIGANSTKIIGAATSKITTTK